MKGVIAMAKRIPAALLITMLASFLVVQPVAAQSGKSQADLSARLAEAQSDPKLSEALFKTGRKVAAVCANCHGEGGNSTKSDIPNLAGQNQGYLLEQIRQFTTGQRRNEFMEGMIKAMNTDEKIGMVIFYGTQPVTHKPSSQTALVAKGKEYFGKTCFRCHGEEGRGSEKFARIAGQQPEYLRATLKRYRAGTGSRVDPLMATNTKLMTDADIDAVVAFVSSMP
jgi:cytochrome c553